jgi:hypothetical protein
MVLSSIISSFPMRMPQSRFLVKHRLAEIKKPSPSFIFEADVQAGLFVYDCRALKSAGGVRLVDVGRREVWGLEEVVYPKVGVDDDSG